MAIRKLSFSSGAAAEGHFTAGSMGPKVDAALRFVHGGGREAIVARLTEVNQALAGKAGTHIVAAPSPSSPATA